MKPSQTRIMLSTAVAAVCLGLLLAALFASPYECAQRLDRGLGSGLVSFTGLCDRLTGFSDPDDGLICVSVQDGPGFRITSGNPVRVARGQTASFDVEIEDGYRIAGLSAGFSLADGKIVAADVKHPMVCVADSGPVPIWTVSLTACDLDGTADGSGALSGAVRASLTGSCPDGTPVTFSASDAELYDFVCYTSGAPASGGGRVLGEDPVLGIDVDSDLEIYANYRKARAAVSFAPAEGISLEPPDSRVVVRLGGGVTVAVSVAGGFRIDGVSAGVLREDGTLILDHVSADTEVAFAVTRLKSFSVRAVSSDPSAGTVSVEGGERTDWEGTEIVAVASASGPEYEFAGFSVGAPLSSGGTAVCDSAVYSFALSADTVLYANFVRSTPAAPDPGDPAAAATVPKNKWLIFYHPNGGVNVKTGDGSYLRTTFSSTDYYCPNARWGNSAFRRDGFVLMGYNTSPDGSGTYYAPGWNILMPESGAVSLYCQWAEASAASDFTYKSNSSGVTLTSYTGGDSFLVIPETLNGKKVTALAAGFLSGNATVRALFISANIRTLPSGAVRDCPCLKELYFSDSVTSVKDDWYTGCPELSTLYVLAYHAPRYCGVYQGSVAIKAEALEAVKGPKLILTGGSNVILGVDSPSLEKKLAAAGRNYTVINLGINAIDAASFYIELASNYVGPGDVIVHCPEVHAATQYGQTDFVTNHWSYFEAAYEVFSKVDIRHYTKVFSTFESFNKARTSTASYESISPNVNDRGDYTVSRPGVASRFASSVKQYDAAGYGPYSYTEALGFVTNEEYRGELNRAFDLCSSKGADVLLSFGVVYGSMLDRASQIPGGEAQTAYEAACDAAYRATRISSVNDYIFTSAYMYDSAFHLNEKGLPVRTQRLADDLLAYFEGRNETR